MTDIFMRTFLPVIKIFWTFVFLIFVHCFFIFFLLKGISKLIVNPCNKNNSFKKFKDLFLYHNLLFQTPLIHQYFCIKFILSAALIQFIKI
jgi:hypothetical protein